jgi:hypothetical protein
METPAPLDPFDSKSSGWSHIWKNPVMCAGEKALASLKHGTYSWHRLYEKAVEINISYGFFKLV